jgi:hypothetical protein
MKTLLTALACLAMAFAAPARAQRIADVAPGAVAHAPPAPAAEMAPAVLAANRGLPPALRPAVPGAREAVTERRLSVMGHTAVGAGAGALAGVLASAALFAFDENCRSGDSMCGLAVPVFIGGGVLTGGVAGLVVGLVRNR